MYGQIEPAVGNGFIGKNSSRIQERTGLVGRIIPDPSLEYEGRFGWLERSYLAYKGIFEFGNRYSKGLSRRLEITCGIGSGGRLGMYDLG